MSNCDNLQCKAVLSASCINTLIKTAQESSVLITARSYVYFICVCVCVCIKAGENIFLIVFHRKAPLAMSCTAGL